MASRLQAIKSVTRTMTPKVKPTDLGMEKSVNKAAMAIINPVKEVSNPYPGGNTYVWGVTWPGKADKWGHGEAPIVDWDEVKKAFKVWKNFAPYNPFEHMGGVLAIAKEVAASKLPTKGGH
ncbi:unnamed protein product [Effrenium voratum]|uniref:Uncharacterized protein n=1 Tax=Effrenium voratum TaxID=2562239 RepID=A0AA36MIB9_9DINO|nr:unnamed protein product [Effrenium voratum]CAJ1426490.1 unnamed protein product [Effrenium voratum]